MPLPSRWSFSVGLGSLWRRIRRSRGLSWIDALRAKWSAQEAAIRARWQAEADRIAAVEAESRKPKPRPPEKRTDRPRRWFALVVGINAYRRAPLRGCITDANRYEARIRRGARRDAETAADTYRQLGWEVETLLDSAATKVTVMARLMWAFAWAETGDRIVLIFSGHGTLLPDPDDPTGSIESLCMYDCLADNSTDTFVRGCLTLIEIMRLINRAPLGVEFTGIIDACHSGPKREQIPYFNAARLLGRPKPIQIPRYLAPPPELARPASRVRHFATMPRTKEIVSADGFEPIFLSGCRAEQTSADTVIDGIPCGAFSAHLLAAEARYPSAGQDALVEEAVSTLKRDEYDQVPVGAGSPGRLARRLPWAESA